MKESELRAVTLEEQVLSSILKKDLFFSVDLTEDDFASQSNRVIYNAIARRARAGQGLDLDLVVEDLRRNGELEKAGGVLHVMQVLGGGFFGTSLREAVERLRDYAIRRKLLDYVMYTQQQAMETETPIEDVLASIQQKVMAISENQLDNESQEDRFAGYESRKNDVRQGRVYKVSTGFNCLDNLLDGGFENGQFVVVAARPSMGKTAFGLKLAANIAHKGKHVLFESLEQTFDKIIDRLIASEGVIDSSRLHSQEGLREIWGIYNRALGEVKRLPLEIDARASATVANIATKARRLRAEGKLDVIVVDYLQLIKGRAGLHANTPREQVVAGIADDLFALAHSLNVPVIALAQTNRGTDSRQDKRPVLTDIGETDRIAMNADIVLALHRDEYYTKEETPEYKRGVVDVLVLKNRDGRIGTCWLNFLPKYVDFCELDDSQLMLVSGRDLTKKETAVVESVVNAGR